MSYEPDPEPSDRLPVMLPFDAEHPHPEHSKDAPRLALMPACLPVEQDQKDEEKVKQGLITPAQVFLYLLSLFLVCELLSSGKTLRLALRVDNPKILGIAKSQKLLRFIFLQY